MDSFFRNFVWGNDGSLDSLESKKETPVKVSSLEMLSGFIRVADNLLVNKAQKDLWKIEKNAEGELVIYRLFDNAGNPIEM